MKTNNPVLYPNEEVAKKVTDYAERHSDTLPAYLVLYHDWVLSQDKSHLTISQYQARALMWLTQAVGAKRILEIGAFRGFSMAVFSHAVGDKDANVLGLETNNEHMDSAVDGCIKFGVKNCSFLQGDAHELLPLISPIVPCDIIFIDAEKSGYVEYLQTILSKSQPNSGHRLLRPGGLIVADNVLRGSLVADPSEDNPAHARQKYVMSSGYWTPDDVEFLDAYNKRVLCEPRLDAFLLPLFDGLSLARLRD